MHQQGAQRRDPSESSGSALLFMTDGFTVEAAQIERDASGLFGFCVESCRNEFEIIAIEMRACLVSARPKLSG